MDARTYFKISCINALFLTAGILISPAIVHPWKKDRLKTTVKAPAAAAKPVLEASKLDPNAEYVSPDISPDSAAVSTLLAGRIAADTLTVNGYDLLKLHNGTLSALQENGILPTSEVKLIIDRAKAAKPLKLQPVVASTP